MPGEQYTIEFVGDPDRFAPAANKVIGDMRNIEKVSRDINARAREQVAIDNQRGALAQKRKVDAFMELATQQKIAMLEERRLRVAQALAVAQSRGQANRALLLGQGMRGIDSGLTLLGGGGFTPFRNGFRRMRQANVIDVQDVGGGGGGGGDGDGRKAPASGGGGKESPDTVAAANSMKGMLKSMALFGGLMHVIRGSLMLPGAAREMSPAAQAEHQKIQDFFKWSQGAITGLSQLANAFTTVVEAVKKGIGELMGGLVQLTGNAVGLGMVGYGKLTGNKLARATGEGMRTDAIMNLPTWMGGLGGSDAEDVIARNKATYKKRLEEKRKDYVDKMLDAAKARIDADREKYNEGVRHRKQQRFEDRKFVYGGDLGGLVGGSTSGLYAAGAGAVVAGQLVSIQKQTLDALKQNVAATKKIAPEIAKLGVNYFAPITHFY